MEQWKCWIILTFFSRISKIVFSVWFSVRLGKCLQSRLSVEMSSNFGIRSSWTFFESFIGCSLVSWLKFNRIFIYLGCLAFLASAWSWSNWTGMQFIIQQRYLYNCISVDWLLKIDSIIHFQLFLLDRRSSDCMHSPLNKKLTQAKFSCAQNSPLLYFFMPKFFCSICNLRELIFSFFKVVFLVNYMSACNYLMLHRNPVIWGSFICGRILDLIVLPPNVIGL